MKKYYRLWLGAGAGAVLLAAPSAFTATTDLVSWDLSGSSGADLTVPGTAIAPNLTPMDVSFGGGLTKELAHNGAFGLVNWTVDKEDGFLQFGFTVQPGYQAHVVGLFASTDSEGTNPAELGPGHMGLYREVGGVDQFIAGWTQQPGGFLEPLVLALDLTVTDTLTLKIKRRDDTSTIPGFPIASTGHWRLHDDRNIVTGAETDMFLHGSVSVVPEPRTYALIAGLGLLAFGYGRRRFAK